MNLYKKAVGIAGTLISRKQVKIGEVPTADFLFMYQFGKGSPKGSYGIYYAVGEKR